MEENKEQNIEVDLNDIDSLTKPKKSKGNKERTEKQKEAFKIAMQKRADNIALKKAQKVLDAVGVLDSNRMRATLSEESNTVSQSNKKTQPIKLPDLATETEDDFMIVKQKKKTKKKKKILIIESSSESSSDSSSSESEISYHEYKNSSRKKEKRSIEKNPRVRRHQPIEENDHKIIKQITSSIDYLNFFV